MNKKTIFMHNKTLNTVKLEQKMMEKEKHKKHKNETQHTSGSTKQDISS
jgi:hypothetical protein